MRNIFARTIAAIKRGHRFVTYDIWRLGKPGEEIPHGFIIKHIRVAILVFRNLTRDIFWLRASALAFTTILSIVPFFAVMFYVIQTFNLEEGVYNFIAERVRSRLITHLQDITETPADASKQLDTPKINGEKPLSGDIGESPESQIGQKTDEEPPLRDVLVEWIFQNVAQKTRTEKGEVLQDPVRALISFAEHSANLHAIGLSGLFIVLAAVFSLMINIEMAFNSIWGVKPTRSWFRIFSDYLLIMLLLPFVAAMILGLSVALQGSGGKPLGFALRFVRYGVVWMFFTLLYFIVPNTRVRFRYALIGGIVGGSAWILNAWVYVSLVSLTGYRMVYASFAQFPLLVIWIYISWVIVLFGAQITFAYQNERTFALERLAADASYAYREAVALALMTEMARRFDSGRGGLEPSTSGAAWNIPMSLVNQTLDQLESYGLVRKCATDPVTYLPSRSLERISLYEVVSAVRLSGEEPSALREDTCLRPLLEMIHDIRSEALSNSLAWLIQNISVRVPGIDTPLQETSNSVAAFFPARNPSESSDSYSS